MFGKFNGKWERERDNFMVRSSWVFCLGFFSPKMFKFNIFSNFF